MNKSILIGITVAVVIVIAIGAFMMEDPDSTNSSQLTEEPAQIEPEKPEGRALTLEFSESIATTASP